VFWRIVSGIKKNFLGDARVCDLHWPFSNPWKERLFQGRSRVAAVRKELIGYTFGLILVLVIVILRLDELRGHPRVG
jgi:hypothetical protein